MPSAEEVAVYQAAQRDLATLAIADLALIWKTIETADSVTVSAIMQKYFPALTVEYGSASALVASDYYMELRAGIGVADAFAVEVVAVIPEGQAQAVARWALGPIFQGNPDSKRALHLLFGELYRLVQQAGRSTLFSAWANDPIKPKFARVPSGKVTCAFCTMLAGRGAVYWSKRSAGEMNHFHGHCDCQPVPIFDDIMPYNPSHYSSKYETARDNAETNRTDDILAEIRREFGLA